MKYRKKPVVVEAVKWEGTNRFEVTSFCRELVSDKSEDTKIGFENLSPESKMFISTREGIMMADVGDWIVKEPFPSDDRKYYPCKPDIFEQTYEAVDE